MAQPMWTKEQKQAIDLRRGTLLLAAAAGSGKTAVLVQRVIDILTDPTDPVEPRQLLVVTFTNAAAAQMNQRIAQRFQELLAADPGNAYLRRQMAGLSAARISTVHSYCTALIRANFQLLGVAPDLRLGDEGDMHLLMADLIDECIEDFYQKDAAEHKEDFAKVLKLFSVKGSDRALPNMVKDIYRFLRSRPFYHDWLEEALAAYDSDLPIEESLWGRLILEDAKAAIKDLKGDLSEAEALYLEELEQLLQTGSWDDCFHFIQKNLALKAKDLRLKDYKSQLEQKLFCCNSTEFSKDLRQLKPVIATLFELVKAFDRRYEEEKQRRRLMDFSDLEHYAIRLLLEKCPGGSLEGKYERTELARQLREELRYVLVDEYQDTNQTQSLIFQSLSKEDNLFMVGDIKQSIYRFRQADPTIFLSHKESFHPYDGENFPATLYLSNNFRSRREVTDSVNYVFSHVMKKDTGEMNYGEGERLIPSATYPDSGSCITEYHRIATRSSSSDDAAEEEAFHVAAQIEKLLNSGFLVSEKGEQRPIQPGDICILLRSPKKRGELFLQALAQRSISSVCDSQQDYLDTVEISTALSLLHAIENPLLDIHLTAALMSVAFRFSADDMARVRLYKRDRALYLNCLDMAREGDGKCRSFVEKLQDYRLRASAAPTWKLLQELLWDSGIMSFASALDQGEQRQANLRLLVDHARRCEDWGYEGVGGFLRYLERSRERHQEIPSAPAVQNDSSAVHILSIHKSKGLEYPVIFLCEGAKSFNLTDLNDKMILHPQYGFACIAGDGEKETTYTSVPLEALRLATRRQLIAEEMRLLYVAMTRAKEKLIITSLVKEKEKDKDKKETGLPNSFDIRQARSYADWLEMTLRFYEAEQPEEKLFHVMDCKAELEEQEEKSVFQRLAPADPTTLRYLKETISIPYSDPAASRIPSKLTVTDIVESKTSASSFFSKEPSFLKEQSITAAQRGTAMHNFLSCADHTAAQTDLEGEIRRMTEARYFTSAEAASLNRKDIRSYYQSELFARISRSKWVKREFPFLMDMGREELGELFQDMGSHRITVQGTADLIFEEDHGIILVDYKTDHLPEEEIAEKYRQQLLLYKMILDRLLDKPVREMLIYSMYNKKTLKIQ